MYTHKHIYIYKLLSLVRVVTYPHVLTADYLGLENLSGDWRILILLLSSDWTPIVLYLGSEPCGFFYWPFICNVSLHSHYIGRVYEAILLGFLGHNFLIESRINWLAAEIPNFWFLYSTPFPMSLESLGIEVTL